MRPPTPNEPRPRTRTTIRRAVGLALALALAVTALAGCLRPGQDEAYRALMNDRRSLGLRSLPTHGAAQQKAQQWADHLAATGTLTHSRLQDGFDHVNWCSIGENVGAGPNVGAIERAYMSSPTHRANIAATKWTHVGIGHAVRGKATYTVQVFLKTC